MIIVGKFPYGVITVFFSVQVNLPCSDGELPYVPIRKKLVTYIIMKIDFFNYLRI